MNALVFDVETTTKSPVGFPATPFWPENRIVVAGWCLIEDGSVGTVNTGDTAAMTDDLLAADILVGCNIKFDLLHLCKDMWLNPRSLLLRTKRLWDVSIVHYLLTGMRSKMPSLEAAAARYHLGTKEGVVSALIKSGVDPADIEPELLKTYLIQDVNLTREVYERQFEEVVERGMDTFVMEMMRSVLVTAEMEHNGIYVNPDLLESYISSWNTDAVAFRDTIILEVAGHFPRDFAFNPDSGQQLSKLFFGGKVVMPVSTEVGTYKNKKPKFKKIPTEFSIDALEKVRDPLDFGATMLADKTHFKVDEGVLDELVKFGTPKSSRVATLIQHYRKTTKLLGTYGEGVQKHLFPDGLIHPSLNHNVTATGRLSCSGPNLQNQADHPFRQVYESRFKGGSLVEIDYGQLEIVGLAILTEDEQLSKDLREGLDIHSELYREMYGRYPSKEERKPFKSLTFGLVYGAGVNTLASNGGVTREQAKKFVQTFYKRYPKVQEFHYTMIERAAKEREISGSIREGRPVEMFQYRSISGRVYSFTEKSGVDYRGAIRWGISPTELKNYPVQGFATADVVPMMLAEIADWLWRSEYSESVLMVMTVHDSLLLDIRAGAEEAVGKIAAMMMDTGSRIKSRFGVNVKVPFSVEVKVGSNWYSKDMEVC